MVSPAESVRVRSCVSTISKIQPLADTRCKRGSLASRYKIAGKDRERMKDA